MMSDVSRMVNHAGTAHRHSWSLLVMDSASSWHWVLIMVIHRQTLDITSHDMTHDMT